MFAIRSFCLMVSILLLTALGLSQEPSKNIILLGVTNAGKSTLGNILVGRSVFEVGHTPDSCTATMSTAEGFLLGDSNRIPVKVSDTGGFGDTEGRDYQFADEIAAHARSIGGAHGFVYVHNAHTKLDKQARETLDTIVATLTQTSSSRSELSSRLSIVVTHCAGATLCSTGRYKSFFEKRVHEILGNDYQTFDIPIFWYDDHAMESGGILTTIGEFIYILFSGEATWRMELKSWVKQLPGHPLAVPSETEREKLKKEHEAKVDRYEKELRTLKELVIQMKTELKQQSKSAERMVELRKEIRLLKEKIESFERKKVASPHPQK